MKKTLKIIETSDVHGYVYDKEYANNTQKDIGFGKLSTYIKEIKNNNNHVLVLDNGDTLQGSPLTYYHHIQSDTEPHFLSSIINTIGYDAVTIGNHDYNYGQDNLKNYTSNLTCEVINANIYKNNHLQYTPYKIKEFSSGLRVAITAVTTHYIPNWELQSNIKGLKFLDAYSSLKQTVKKIKTEETYDLLVVLYHGGFEKDIFTDKKTEPYTGENQGHKMFKNIPEIDVFLTGHQHRSLAIDNAPNNTTILQPTSNGEEVGEATITFFKDANSWKILDKQPSLIKLKDYAFDPEIYKITNSLEKRLQTWLDKPLGKLKKGNLLIEDMHRARLNKHPIVSFINTVQLAATGADISCNALANSISGFNHEITYRDIISTYVYPNTLVVLEISGKTLKNVLQQNAQYFTLKNNEITVNKKFTTPKQQHYNYDMYDGIDYTIEVSNDETLVTNITYNNAPLKDDDTLTLALNNYRASDGDEFLQFRRCKLIKEISTDMIDLIANYIKERHVVDIEHNNNIHVMKKP